MPIKGVLMVLLGAVVIAALERDKVYDWLNSQFGLDDGKEDKEDFE